MAKYADLLRSDLAEQFKEKPVIDSLMEAIGQQLDDVYQFYADLRDKRSVQTAEGKQLDGVGYIAVLSRMEAGVLACINESVYVLNDDDYRRLLIYKIWKNTNNCTYYDVIRAFRMFWDKELYYSEDPEIPATMLFETGMLSPEEDAQKILNAPFIKAAGVAIRVTAKTETPEMSVVVPISSVGGRGYMTTELPEIPLENGEFVDSVHPGSVAQSIVQTTLPRIEEE